MKNLNEAFPMALENNDNTYIIKLLEKLSKQI
jgi:hypothetical protein